MRRNVLIRVTIGATVLIGIALLLRVIIRPAPIDPLSGIATSAGFLLPSTGLYIERARDYAIAANYPTTTPLKASVGAAANAAALTRIRNYVSGTIAQFKTGLAHLSQKETLQIVYLISSSSHTVSYIFTIYENTGGAHAVSFFKTFTFNTETGAELSLANLFVAQAPYLDVLSSISRANLPSVIGTSTDAAFIKSGTTPEAKNFENFFIDNSELVILFPPYQVGPGALGPQTLSLPLTDFLSILKSTYR